MKRNYVKQFVVTLIAITMFTGYPFFTWAEDLNGGGKLPLDLSTGLIDQAKIAKGETSGLKKLISDALELAISSFGGTALQSDTIDETTNLSGYHFKDYAGDSALLNGNIGSLSDMVFNNNTVTFETDAQLRGGGILNGGQIGDIDKAIFSNNTVTKTGARNFTGGGIIGAYTGTIGDISNSIFTDNIVTISRGSAPSNLTPGIQGGGIAGAAYNSTVGDIVNNVFYNNTITSFDAVVGGGIVGVYYDSTMGDIVNNVFYNNTINTSGVVYGGGIVGAYNNSTMGNIIDCTFTNNIISASQVEGGGIAGNFGFAYMGITENISGSVFANNTITADYAIEAGILYTANNLTVTDSQFTDNTFTITGTREPRYVYGGAITLDTGAYYDDFNVIPETLSLTIAATAGNTTIFRNNEINDIGGQRTNSISIRSTNAINLFASRADATLTISTLWGGAVYLYDPIYVEQNSGKTFGMDVTEDGKFFWGGDNKFIVDAPDAEKNIVYLRRFTNTTLMSGFNLDAPNHDFNMNARSNMFVEPGTSMTVHAANLIGMVAFYPQDVLVNNQDNPLLTVTADSINIDGMWAHIGLEGYIQPLQFGDKYYLLHGSTELAGNIDPDKTIQTVQHGSLFEFTLQLKKDGDNDLVAELIESGGSGGGGKTPVVPGAKSITEGASVGAALANQGADLAAGAGMGSAINSAKEDAWGAFAVVDASSMRYNTGSSIDTSSVNLMAGISRNINTEIGKLTAGAFFEYGGTSYDIHGSGNASYIGGGLLGHLKFNDVGPGHFYTEAAARIGGLNNDYESNRLKDTFERKASFDTESTYYGIHAGVGYVWNITEEASLDVYGKYFWLHQDGNDATISTGEPVSFDPIDSHRLRGGARFTYAINEYVSPYIGAAFEYEFDGKARASVWGYDLEAAKPEGETGIGEAGLIFKPFNKSPWLVDLGVQGYVGKREGVSGSLRVGVEF